MALTKTLAFCQTLSDSNSLLSISFLFLSSFSLCLLPFAFCLLPLAFSRSPLAFYREETVEVGIDAVGDGLEGLRVVAKLAGIAIHDKQRPFVGANPFFV